MCVWNSKHAAPVLIALETASTYMSPPSLLLLNIAWKQMWLAKFLHLSRFMHTYSLILWNVAYLYLRVMVQLARVSSVSCSERTQKIQLGEALCKENIGQRGKYKIKKLTDFQILQGSFLEILTYFQIWVGASAHVPRFAPDHTTSIKMGPIDCLMAN